MSSGFDSLVEGNGDASAERAPDPPPPGPATAGGPSTGGAGPAQAGGAGGRPTGTRVEEPVLDLAQRRDQLRARFAELQWDLGGLAYEMAIRDHIRVEVLVRQAALLQDVDAELGEVERILHIEETGTAGSCAACGAPHSAGAVYCWQCGQPLMRHVPSDAIGGNRT